MAFDIYLFTFSKRQNSTKKPKTDSGVKYSGLLRDKCGVVNPTMGIEFASGFNPSEFNYAYIPTFGRYYWISEWTASGRLWICSMRVDALASWKSQIGGSTQYVLRSAATRDQYIPDMMYPTKAKPKIVSEYQDFESWSYSFSAGRYIIGFISSSDSGIGVVSYYAFTNGQFRDFCNNMLSSTSWLGDIQDVSEDLLKALFNPFQYIASAVWVPFSVSGTNVSSIPLGWGWSINANATRMSGSMLYSDAIEFTVPIHPDYADFGNYLHSAPFSRYTMDVPPFGSFPLDANIAATCETIVADVSVDAVTGIGRLQIRGNDYTFADSVTQVGVTIPIAQSSLNVGAAVQAAGGLGGAAINAITGNISGAVSSAAGAIASAVDFATPEIVSRGSIGSIAGLGPAKITGVFYQTAPKANALLGSPYCRSATLGNLPGYQLILNPDISAPATDGEIAAINSALAAGYFYE